MTIMIIAINQPSLPLKTQKFSMVIFQSQIPYTDKYYYYTVPSVSPSSSVHVWRSSWVALVRRPWGRPASTRHGTSECLYQRCERWRAKCDHLRETWTQWGSSGGHPAKHKSRVRKYSSNLKTCHRTILYTFYKTCITWHCIGKSISSYSYTCINMIIVFGSLFVRSRWVQECPRWAENVVGTRRGQRSTRESAIGAHLFWQPLEWQLEKKNNNRHSNFLTL